jgi:hypothetical protein
MTDIIVIAVVAVIVGLAVGYIYKAKKGGKKCVGCPYGSSCSAKEHARPTCCCGVYEQEQ